MIAVLIVFFSHLIMVFGRLDDPIATSFDLRGLAQTGVLIFFIHTSLVLMMSLERMHGPHIILKFYIRRAFRIYPLAIVMIVIVLVLRIPPHFETEYLQPGWSTVWENLLLVQNLFHAPEIVGPMWSLPLEVQMYLLLPLLYVIARRISTYAGAIALLGSGFVVWYFARSVVQFAPWFFMGISAYCLYRFVKPHLSPALYGVCVLLFAGVQPMTHQLMPGDYRSGWVLWIAGIFLTLSLPHFHEIRSPFLRKIAHIVATYSYSIYLVHVPIMTLAFQWFSGTLLVQWLYFVLLMILTPLFLYHGLELPLIRAGSQIAEELGGRIPQFSQLNCWRRPSTKNVSQSADCEKIIARPFRN
jgi:peptidoglycan/LPS O-acetylase OafA/YrhL